MGEAGPAGELAAGEREWRRARREFIRARHPDRGGDPGSFAAGLAALDHPAGRPACRDAPPRVVVIPDRPWLASLLASLARRAGWRVPPPRVR